jgi:hypothetical protein
MRWLSQFWCRHFHGQSIMHPAHGQYRCRKCLRAFPTQWEGAPTKPQVASPEGQLRKGEA